MNVSSVTNQIRNFSKGFTLVELLVVIALLGIILSIVIVSTQESREQSQNAAVIAQVYEYEKALQLYFAETGSFPNTPHSGAGIICLGDDLDSDFVCLNSRDGVQVVSRNENTVDVDKVHDALAPYMPSQPHILQPKGGYNFSSPAYSGCADFTRPGEPNNNMYKSCTGSNFSLWFVLKGTNQDCGRATVARSDFVGVYTLCRLQQ